MFSIFVVPFILLKLLYFESVTSFRIYFNNNRIFAKNSFKVSNQFDNNDSFEVNEEEQKTIKQEIDEIICGMMIKLQNAISTDEKFDQNKLLNLDINKIISPNILFENSHFLTKSELLDEVFNEKIMILNNKLSEELVKDDERQMEQMNIKILEELHIWTKPIISNEKKQRAKLKISYLLAGATTNRLEEAINMLSDADELDENLLIFIESLIKKEMIKSGPNSDFGNGKLSPTGNL